MLPLFARDKKRAEIYGSLDLGQASMLLEGSARTCGERGILGGYQPQNPHRSSLLWGHQKNRREGQGAKRRVSLVIEGRPDHYFAMKKRNAARRITPAWGVI